MSVSAFRDDPVYQVANMATLTMDGRWRLV